MRTPACVLFMSATVLAAHQHSATVDPCKLATAAEVQTVLGVGVAAPELTDADPYRTCQYNGTDGGHHLWLTVQDMEQADFEQGMKILKHGLPVGSGIGPDAYTQRGGSGNLYVWKKGTELTIHLEDQSGNTSPEKREEGQEKIARIALSRM